MPFKYRLMVLCCFLSFILILAIALLTPLSRKEPKLQFDMQSFENELPQPQGVYHIFASWCLKCKLDQERFKEANLQPIGILFDPEDIENIEQFKKIYRHILIPKSNKAIFKLKITGVPETLLVDEQGLVIEHFKGPLTMNDFKKITPLKAAINWRGKGL